ncbi:hypothetical protein BABINDRAFT_6705 [Babjeviella inositovora NRRL Y-12698]|uniref:USP domain-containing protein n=1 Tax=Babjeviella inositovora NRRL Y-12698 TaxID=984486 RepID=A0A1E3QWR1_9ASCO|nr:uncharacterized protein BABINDRAFT_6705 [Babjeviella inositovora NRRL Y-12698]ODQ82096.1 hypothetical protein BABINDRAFT_6705 [Babjeviella inositovora NRRL Y-12698]
MPFDELRNVKRQKVAIESPSDSLDGGDYEDPPQLRPLSEMQTLYLETIDRSRLDFDFEKVCSVSLAKVNVYACLVCSKYFQGRNKASYAYLHSINDDHHVYINLSTLRIYILPENREVTAKNLILEDIKYLVDPAYTPEQIAQLSTRAQAYDLNHKAYRAGYVGLNNINANDYANVVLQLLSHVPPVRDFYLANPALIAANELNSKFGLLVRKMWSSKLFKAHVSPHELLQYIDIASKNTFTITNQKEPKDLFVWLLNQLHAPLAKVMPKGTVIARAFQGKIRIMTQKVVASTNKNTNTVQFTTDTAITTSDTRFWILTLDLPSQLLFKKDNLLNGQAAIAQCSLLQLLAKYNGYTVTSSPGAVRKYKIIKLPKYLILHFNRFPQGMDHADRNQTVVKFPTVLDMAPYVENQTAPLHYKLLGNAIHEVVTDENNGVEGKDRSLWKVQLEDGKGWVRIHDLKVDEIEKELLFLEESYVQIWARV